MPQKPTDTAMTAQVTIEAPPELWAFQLQRKADPSSETPEIPLELGVGLTRFAVDVVGVELTVSSKDGSPIAFSAAYRAVFRLHLGEGSTVDDHDKAIRRLSINTGPSVIYPYIRETVATSALKAGFRNITLPLLNFARLFDEEKVQVPSTPETPIEGETGSPAP